MTRVEYGIQYQREDGTWHQSIAGDLEQMATPAGALAALDRARDMYPDDAWRVVYRPVQAWATAYEDALRDEVAAEVAAYAALAADREETAIEGALRDRRQATPTCGSEDK